MSTYTRREVEALLPTVWDELAAYGLQNPTAPAPDMPKAASNKAHANTLYAMLADIRQAWEKADLTLQQRRALYLRFAWDLRGQDIGDVLGVRQQVAQRHVERGVGHITAWLNGEPYVDGYDPQEVEAA